MVSGLLKIDFSMKVFVFLVSGVLKIDFSMRIFVFLASGIVEDGAVPFFHVNLRCLWDPPCFFNESLCFFVSGLLKMDFSMRFFVFFRLRPIENRFFNESVCFLVSGIVEDGAVPLFLYELTVFLRPE